MSPWEEYERRKKIISFTSESSEEYAERIRKLAEELGL